MLDLLGAVVNDTPLVPRLRLPSLRPSCGLFLFIRSPLASVSQLSMGSYVRLFLLHALTMVFVLSSVCLHSLRNYNFVPSGNDALWF